MTAFLKFSIALSKVCVTITGLDLGGHIVNPILNKFLIMGFSIITKLAIVIASFFSVLPEINFVILHCE